MGRSAAVRWLITTSGCVAPYLRHSESGRLGWFGGIQSIGNGMWINRPIIFIGARFLAFLWDISRKNHTWPGDGPASSVMCCLFFQGWCSIVMSTCQRVHTMKYLSYTCHFLFGWNQYFFVCSLRWPTCCSFSALVSRSRKSCHLFLVASTSLQLVAIVNLSMFAAVSLHFVVSKHHFTAWIPECLLCFFRCWYFKLSEVRNVWRFFWSPGGTPSDHPVIRPFSYGNPWGLGDPPWKRHTGIPQAHRSHVRRCSASLTDPQDGSVGGKMRKTWFFLKPSLPSKFIRNHCFKHQIARCPANN